MFYLRLKRASGGPDRLRLLCQLATSDSMPGVNETISENEGRVRRMNLTRRHYVVRENMSKRQRYSRQSVAPMLPPCPSSPPLRPREVRYPNVRGHIPANTKGKATPCRFLCGAFAYESHRRILGRVLPSLLQDHRLPVPHTPCPLTPPPMLLRSRISRMMS